MMQAVELLDPALQAVKWGTMHFLKLGVSLLGVASAVQSQSSSADAYAASEGPIAKAGVLANIGPSGAKCQGAKAGVVVASPSVRANFPNVCRGNSQILLCRRPTRTMFSPGRAIPRSSSRCSSISTRSASTPRPLCAASSTASYQRRPSFSRRRTRAGASRPAGWASPSSTSI